VIVLPPRAGIGVRAAHYQAILDHAGDPGWYEIHSENFFADGGPALLLLDQLARRAPLSFHGVGLGLGSVDPIDPQHLETLARLVERYAPAAVSEHLCWGHAGGWFANDLLPMPYTEAAVDLLAARIGAVQDRLRRPLLIENVSSYVRFATDEMEEWEFATAVCRRAGCYLLLDINNIHVNASNHGFSAEDFLLGIDPGLVRELHLAGHQATPWGLIDTHDTSVAPEVWSLYRRALRRFGPVATLVEWDHQLPPFETLLGEIGRAAGMLAELARE
jgi:uncharacterized protein (UPF0276 family)